MKIPLLDLGNVILKVDFNPFLQWVSEHSETKDLSKIHQFSHSSLYYDFEFGNINAKEFIERMSKLVNGNFPEEEFRFHFCNIMPSLVDGMGEVLEKLRKSGNVYCLSNTNELHYEHFMEKYKNELSLFTNIYASHKLRKRKPYPGIYKEVTRQISAEPQNIIFFDDVEANVLGAQRAGLEAYLFKDSAQVESLCLVN
jgi:glucose-1-phosphatase